MIATLPAQGNDLGQVAGSPSRQQPPSERDFELYLALVAESLSTREAAARFAISQTRVLQVRSRVVDWLAMQPPPLEGLPAHARLRVLGEAAKLRLDHLLATARESWEASKGATTKIRAASQFDEITTTTTSHGDVRYLALSMQLNLGYVKLVQAIEVGAIKLQSLASGDASAVGNALRGVPEAETGREEDASRSPETSPDGECSRIGAGQGAGTLAQDDELVARDYGDDTCNEFSQRRRAFLATLGGNTTPVQPPDEDEAEQEVSVLPLAAGAEGLAGVSGSAPSLTRRASTGRPLSRKERRARKRLLSKLKRKAR